MRIMSTQARPEDPTAGPRPARRILFLDDDPARAEVFLADNPEAVWVQTAEECIAHLQEEWHEVHLDHDLGGERFVDLSREDCGMEVVRWLCLEPHPHLKPTRFLVHSHNPVAASMMVMQIHLAGFHVENRPFGVAASAPPLGDAFWNQQPGWPGWLARLRTLASRILGRKPEPGSKPDPVRETPPGAR
jgi:hypothetical protein